MGIETTKESILNVASRLFSRFGFHKTSMDEISKIARKAKGSLYYHFASKEELFKEVVSKEFEYLKEQLSVIIDDSSLSSSDKIRKYLIRRMEIMYMSVNYHETLKADFFEKLSFVDDLRAELDLWEKTNLKKIVMQGISNNEFCEIDEIDIILDMFIMVQKGLEIPFFIQNNYQKYSPYFDNLIGILIKGIHK